MAKLRFHQYAWGLLGYNLVVILGGAFVRATMSGDGCGAHWPLCSGVLIPDTTRVGTAIELTHRLSTGLLLALVIGLVVWAFRGFPRGHSVRGGAVAVLALTLLEALIGAWLVKFKLVAHDQSVYRAVAMPVHLVATFLLLGALTLTAWWASGGPSLKLRGQGAVGWAVGLGLVTVLLLGVSGAITALGDTLFPGHAETGPPHFLKILRHYHPHIALSAGVYLGLLAGLLLHFRPGETMARYLRAALGFYGIQLTVGLLNFALEAPVWMQLIHLLLADCLWISLVLTTAAVLSNADCELRIADCETPASDKLSGLPEAVVGSARSIRNPQSAIRNYVALTKPRVISLLLFTTLAAMYIAAAHTGRPAPGFWLLLAVGAGLYMAAGAANAINMVLERDLDERMGRTARRPTVTQVIPPRAALLFALALMAGSFGLLWSAANLLCALLAQAGLAFYVVIYTLLLKRRTWTNIVIGGAAGAFPPLVGWAAVTGDLSPLAWCLFGIIFLWTPVHFWALALLMKEDYARAGVPMLPCVRGERATVVQILGYTLLTAAISVVPLALRAGQGGVTLGWLYLSAAVLLNAGLLVLSLKLYRRPERPQASVLFRYSMVYLALLFLAMAVDRVRFL